MHETSTIFTQNSLLQKAKEKRKTGMQQEERVMINSKEEEMRTRREREFELAHLKISADIERRQKLDGMAVRERE